jgi:hypothetical protein
VVAGTTRTITGNRIINDTARTEPINDGAPHHVLELGGPAACLEEFVFARQQGQFLRRFPVALEKLEAGLVPGETTAMGVAA